MDKIFFLDRNEGSKKGKKKVATPKGGDELTTIEKIGQIDLRSKIDGKVSVAL